MARLEIVCDPSLNARAPGGFPCAIHATSQDGRKYLAEVPDPPGFSRHGIGADAVIAKFKAVAADNLGPNARDRIIEAAMALDKSKSCVALTDALAAGA